MRIECSVRPQSSTRGSARSRNCVSTVPTEPAAVFDAGVAMGGIISAVSAPGMPMYDPGPFPRVDCIERVHMAMTSVNNGVNVQALLDAREVLKGAPEAA